MKRIFSLGAALLLSAAASRAHDSWVETNTNLVRVGDAVHIHLKLGNHGNDHRDFKLAGKLDPLPSTLQVLAPGGARYDLKPGLIDTGYTPKDGFWTTSFVGDKPGLYCVAHTYDSVVSYAPERAIKSAKTFFVVSSSLDRVPRQQPGFDRRLNHALELVPENNPVTLMGPGSALTVRVWFKGKPLTNCRVSFIPQGEVLRPGFDARFEQKTNKNGRVRFTPTGANVYLIAAHHRDDKARGKGYNATKYGATMTLFVPQICPCC